MSEKEKRKIIVIKGGNLINGTGAKPKKNAAIVIEGTRIIAVNEEGEVGDTKES